MTGQFSYASVARLPDSDRGGWGVLERRGIDADDEQAAMPWLTTRLTSLPGLPPFPTPADLAGRSRRLRVHQTRDGRVLLVHAVEAGPDATGRPGNVFNHVLILDADQAGRAVELWNSPQWCTPYGPEEVAAARLPADLGPGPLTRAETLGWLRSTQAGTSLGWLLDTVAFCVDEGRPLVVLTDDPDEAAHWIAAITQLCARAAALRLGWSTVEDPQSLGWAIKANLDLICVQREQFSVDELPVEVLGVDPGWEGQEILPGDDPTVPDGGWRLPNGLVVPTSRWQRVVFDVLQVDDPQRLLDEADALADSITGAARAPFFWALALALLDAGEADDASRSDLVAAVLRWGPATADHPLLDRLAEEYIAEAERADLDVLRRQTVLPAVRSRLGPADPPGWHPEDGQGSGATPGAAGDHRLGQAFVAGPPAYPQSAYPPPAGEVRFGYTPPGTAPAGLAPPGNAPSRSAAPGGPPPTAAQAASDAPTPGPAGLLGAPPPGTAPPEPSRRPGPPPSGGPGQPTGAATTSEMPNVAAVLVRIEASPHGQSWQAGMADAVLAALGLLDGNGLPDLARMNRELLPVAAHHLLGLAGVASSGPAANPWLLSAAQLRAKLIEAHHRPDLGWRLDQQIVTVALQAEAGRRLDPAMPALLALRVRVLDAAQLRLLGLLIADDQHLLRHLLMSLADPQSSGLLSIASGPAGHGPPDSFGRLLFEEVADLVNSDRLRAMIDGLTQIADQHGRRRLADLRGRVPGPESRRTP